MIGSIVVSCIRTNQQVSSKKVQEVVLQVDFRVRQLLAMNPGSPLGVSKNGGIREQRYVSIRQGTYRKIAPLFLGGFLLINASVLFGVSLRLIDAD